MKFKYLSFTLLAVIALLFACDDIPEDPEGGNDSQTCIEQTYAAGHPNNLNFIITEGIDRYGVIPPIPCISEIDQDCGPVFIPPELFNTNLLEMPFRLREFRPRVYCVDCEQVSAQIVNSNGALFATSDPKLRGKVRIRKKFSYAQIRFGAVNNELAEEELQLIIVSNEEVNGQLEKRTFNYLLPASFFK
ncbi:MAG: hypothetical protein AAGA85_13980 [Bacteroidota bacterium]